MLKRRGLRKWAMGVLGIALSLAACQLVFPAELATTDGGAPRDSSIDRVPDTKGDAGDAATYDGPTIYHDLSAREYWSTFDTRTLGASTVGFFGGAFDGTHVYFAPTSIPLTTAGSTAVQYDTTATFTAGPSWSTFNLMAASLNAVGFAGVTFDGRYLYFVPGHEFTFVLPSPGLVARYDPARSFTLPTAWTTFSTATLIDSGTEPDSGGLPPSPQYQGATFDGRYIYFVPDSSYNILAVGNIAVRYDTHGGFATPAAWSTFDTTSVSGSPGTTHLSYCGAVFDGRYIYFVPANIPGVLRYDTRMPFTAPSSWSEFDTTPLVVGDAGDAGLATYFEGGAFDGRFVYLVPLDGPVLRFDTEQSFESIASWSSFNPSILTPNGFPFGGATFDGRFVYFAGSVVVRYDTTGTFTGASAWSTFDTGTLADGGVYPFGAVFDGRYVYFVPNIGGDNMPSGLVVRFDAKTPPSMPKLPAYFGSFL
jgi:hypothetical protein